MLCNKSEVQNILKHMPPHANKRGHSIKKLLNDNGGEFDESEEYTVKMELYNDSVHRTEW